MGLLYKLHTMVKRVCYMGDLDPMVGHYRMDIISGVAHLRSDSVMPLVLCTVACSGWSTDIVLQVPRDSASPTEKG
jgi:hypothetical protein